MDSHTVLPQNELVFSNDWFEKTAKNVWDVLVP